MIRIRYVGPEPEQLLAVEGGLVTFERLKWQKFDDDDPVAAKVDGLAPDLWEVDDGAPAPAKKTARKAAHDTPDAAGEEG